MIRGAIGTLIVGLWLHACAPAAELDDVAAAAPDLGETAAAAIEPDPITASRPGAFPIRGYPDGWALQTFWSGEYPNAFAVAENGVTVPAYDMVAFDEPPAIACPLPANATYSPWNSARNATDALQFIAMVFPTTITLQETVRLDVLVDDQAETLELTAGDQLIYKHYLAEGFFIAERDEIYYELNEADLPASTLFEQGPDDHEWLRVTCADAAGTQAWIRFSEALKAPGLTRYEHTGFGIAADLP
ncbi:MAG: hypothetical protein AAGL90_07425 [Pseudomonadota bacterium]